MGEKGAIPYFCGLEKCRRLSAKGSNCMDAEETKCTRTTYNTDDGTVCKLKIKSEGTGRNMRGV